MALSTDSMSPRFLELTALMAAAGAGQLECMELLLPLSDLDATAGMLAKNIIGCEWTALGFAARAARETCMRALIAAGARPLGKGSGREISPLMMAAGEGSARCLAMMLEVSKPGDRLASTPLSARSGPFEHCVSMAAASGDKECFELAMASADAGEFGVMGSGRDALHSAAKGGHVEIARALISRCDPRRQDEDGLTALMVAARGNDADMVAFLAPFSDVGARSSATSRSVAPGTDALMLLAAHSEDASVAIAAALAAGADPQARSGNGSTALIISARGSYRSGPSVVNLRALLPWSDPRAVDANGENAAMASVGFGTRERIEERLRLLLPLTDPRAVDADGHDIFEHAATGFDREHAVPALGRVIAEMEHAQISGVAGAGQAIARRPSSI